MNNLEETYKYLILLKRKGEARNVRKQEKIAKRNLLERYKINTVYPKKYRYFEWTEGRGDNGKEYTSTEGKTEQI